jgi:hypothetical protein
MNIKPEVLTFNVVLFIIDICSKSLLLLTTDSGTGLVVFWFVFSSLLEELLSV